jgi:MSHA type pilus biogenesis protein MshL
MADYRMKHIITTIIRQALPLFLVVFLAACAAENRTAVNDDHLVKDGVPRSPDWKVEQKEPAPELQPPAFVSMPEDIIPFKTKIVNIVVRNSPFRDVLHIIANASGLNLLADRDVPLDLPMTLSLRNATAEDALKTVVANADCFYTITNNVIKIESVSTRVFEMGHPALINTYSMDVGGSASTAGMSGSIRSGGKADDKAQDFWGSLESSLNSIFDKKDTPATQSPTNGDAAIKAAPRSEGQLQQSITINRLTGTIMVTASRKNLEKIEHYLDNVRKVLGRQVMIEARIIEVNLSDGLNYGIDWSFLENFKGLGNSALNTGFGTLNVGNTLQTNATADAAGSGKFQVGITRGNFQGLMAALKTQGDIKTLSNPKINVMNGHPSILTVGTNTSFISRVTTTTTATASGNMISFAPETTSVLSGMIIGIVPFISEKGDISLNITPITSDLIDLKDKTFGSAGNLVTITIPTVALREMTTTVKMRDGQMVIIGGLISKKESSNQEKIPFLGDIPYLGKLLFTRTNNLESRSELVLLLRPQIVENE